MKTFKFDDEVLFKVDMFADAAYLYIQQDGDVVRTVAHSDSINIDYDDDDEVVGYEILSLGERFPVSELPFQDSWELNQANDALDNIDLVED